jgi:metal-sulfur cluster biosynthetic enzyme
MKFQPAKYYADDKDIHDILSSPKISVKKLLSLARERGMFISEECQRQEEVVHYMSMLPFSWTQLQEVMDSVEREDKEEKLAPCKVALKAEMEDIHQAVVKVRQMRGEKLGENYSITQSKEGRLYVKVTYTEPDFQKARLIQRREKEAIIEVEKKSNDLEIRHTQNEKTDTILTEILDALTPPESAEKLARRNIELSGINNHEHRTQFFINLIGGMEGFQLRQVKDLKVDRISEGSAEPVEEEDNDEGNTDEKQDQLKALVRKVALTGDNILLSPQYQQLARDGFFISKSVWTSAEVADKGRLFEFDAEFMDAENASSFAYHIRGVYDRDKDGELVKVRSNVSDTEKAQLKQCLEDAAYDSVEKVNALQTPSPPTAG